MPQSKRWVDLCIKMPHSMASNQNKLFFHAENMPGKVWTSISSKCKNTCFKASIFFSNKQVRSASLMAIDSGKIHFHISKTVQISQRTASLVVGIPSTFASLLVIPSNWLFTTSRIWSMNDAAFFKRFVFSR